MPTWLKVVLAIIVGGVLLLVAVCFAGVYWFKQNEGMFKQKAEKVMKEAKAFGDGKSPDACIDEGLRQLRESSGITDQIRVRIFVRGCMEASTMPAGYCDNVPSKDHPIDAGVWVAEQCNKRGLQGNQACTNVMQSVPEFCHSSRRR